MSDFQEMRCGACGNTEAKIQAEPTVGMYGFSAFRFICKCGCISEFRVGGYIRQNVIPKDLPENSQDGSWCVGWRKKEEPEKSASPEYIITRRDWPPDYRIGMEDIELDNLPVGIKPWITTKLGTLVKAKAFWSKGTVRVSDIYDAQLQNVFNKHECDEYGTLYFIDLYPEANWAHECLYILQLAP